MVDSTGSPAVEWWLGVPDDFPGCSAGSYHRLGKAREVARGVQMPLHAREIVESTIELRQGPQTRSLRPKLSCRWIDSPQLRQSEPCSTPVRARMIFQTWFAIDVSARRRKGAPIRCPRQSLAQHRYAT
jgi:hypothetical protein